MKYLKKGQIISGVIAILILVAGLAAAIALVSQKQDIRERATGKVCLSSDSCNGKPVGYSCMPGNSICKETNPIPNSTVSTYCKCTITNCQGLTPINCNSSCKWITCPVASDSGCYPLNATNTQVCASTFLGPCKSCNQEKCKTTTSQCLSSKNTCTKDEDCATNTLCKTEGQFCSNAQKCCSGYECKFADPSDQPVCVKSGGGGNGDGNGETTPTEPPKTGKPKPTGGGDDVETNNPSKFGPFNKAGEVIVFVQPAGYAAKMALKKNADTCSFEDKEVLIDLKSSSTNPVSTGLTVAAGDNVCVYIENISPTTGDTNKYPVLGWIKPDGTKCGAKGYNPLDISSLVSQAAASGNLVVSTQCWADYDKKFEGDYNDFALIFTVGGGASGEGLNILFRLQGITTKVAAQIFQILFKSGGSEVKKVTGLSITPSESGIFTAIIDPAGICGTDKKYDIFIKGVSFLQKKFSDIPVPCGTSVVDKSKNDKDELKAGDVNGDNAITVEDIAKVLTYYTTFSVPVTTDDMKAADINKDGVITIQDVALAGLNWNDFVVEGD